MTDFEKGILFVEFLGTANTVFANYMTLVFAMLTASYFAAHRMKLYVALLFLVIYSIAALQTGSGVIFAFSDFMSLGSWIHETSDPLASDLTWLGPVGPGGENMSSMAPFVGGLVGTTYVGSIGFFLLVRYSRADLVKDET